MKLFIEKENLEKEIKLNEKASLKDILKEQNISLDSVILVKNDAICLEDEIIEDSDEIKLLSVVSGG